MARRGAPEPDPGPDPEGPNDRSAAPFFGALAVIVVLAVVVLGAQLFSPSGENVGDDELVRRTVTDYVTAHNGDDDQVLDRLRCDDLPADEAPLTGVEGSVELQATQNISVDGDRGTADVRVRTGDEPETSTWQFVRVGDNWRVCRF
ncbi:hypothetical protein OED52_16975 [Rhodococcus sp. Z13]|uniref:Uncharacterized protein n=1 Tax=Rhodococcus sacchari TaxID=2962047 RepID=A0ACD4DE35_9NOCA|nr:hypothetical protein [Rhodococcus sp. Z13]UYP18335.1 hypothetical protein OED52_16975 [Rhodococcus sp. Z13]